MYKSEGKEDKRQKFSHFRAFHPAQRFDHVQYLTLEISKGLEWERLMGLTHGKRGLINTEANHWISFLKIEICFSTKYFSSNLGMA